MTINVTISRCWIDVESVVAGAAAAAAVACILIRIHVVVVCCG